jgi:hypothetical protein
VTGRPLFPVAFLVLTALLTALLSAGQAQ